MATHRAKKPEKALALLLHEITDCLVAAGSDSGSQQSGANSLVTRMRTVLDALIDRFVNESTGNISGAETWALDRFW